jgi:hypothetical protein
MRGEEEARQRGEGELEVEETVDRCSKIDQRMSKDDMLR